MNRYEAALEKHSAAIAKRLSRDETLRRALEVAEEAAVSAGNDRLARTYAAVRENRDPAALFAAFAHMTDPTAGKTSRPWKYLDWICSCYLNSSFLEPAEDLYKIRDDLAYFEAAGGKLAPEQREIARYDSFAALQETLRPFIQERDRRKAEREERHMEETLRQKIANETTIIYDGPEGKIVVPHTKDSCIYWGRQTKWCISAEKANNFFKSYNDNEPIWIYLTKPTQQEKEAFGHYSSYKFAGTANTLYGEHDDRWESIPPHLHRLIRAALPAIPRHVRRHLKKLGGFRKLKPLLPADPAQWAKPDTLLKAVSLDTSAGYFFPPSLCRDTDFMTKAIRANKYADSFADPELLADRAFVLAVIEAGHPAILEKATKNLQKDVELALAAISRTKKLRLVDDMSDDLRNDKTFMMKATGINGNYLKLADKALRNDRDLIVAALTSAVPAYIHPNDIPSAFLDDKEVALHLVSRNQYSYENLSRRLRQDEDVQLALVANSYGSTLSQISIPLITKKVALCALQKPDYPYQIPYDDDRKLTVPHLPFALLDDADIMGLLAERQPDALQFASDRLRDDRAFVMAIAAKNGKALEHASARLKQDRELVLTAIKTYPDAVKTADPQFFDDDGIMRIAIAGNGLLLEHASYRLKGNRAAVVAAETATPGALAYATLDLRLDRTLKARCILKRIWNKAVAAPAEKAAEAAKGRLRSAWNKAAAGVSSFAVPRLPPPQP